MAYLHVKKNSQLDYMNNNQLRDSYRQLRFAYFKLSNRWRRVENLNYCLQLVNTGLLLYLAWMH